MSGGLPDASSRTPAPSAARPCGRAFFVPAVNIFVLSLTNFMLRVAIPNKGRLNRDCRDLLNDAGLEVRASSERALTASLGGEFEAIFVRAQDIPEFVVDGAADAEGLPGHAAAARQWSQP